ALSVRLTVPTRRSSDLLWHEHSSEPLPAIDGDENLVLAVAFYSPDHPVPTTASFHKCLGTTCQATPEKGWAAMCFYGDVACNEAMSRTASVVTEIGRAHV